MASNLDLVPSTDEIQSRLPSIDYTLGKGRLQPNNSTNSGPRKIMQITQREQVMTLERGEAAIVMTGDENQFGEFSSSFIRTEANYRVIDKIEKHCGASDSVRKSNYWLILIDESTGILHAVERIDYRHITESYGYQYDNTYMDRLKVGDNIVKGTPIKKSASFDSVNNKCDGINLTTVYMSSARTTDDPIIISASAAARFSAPLFKYVQVVINDNDILLNLYGDDVNYKAFPDIGEEIDRGILCALRRERKDDEALYTQAWERLKDIMIADEKYPVKGKVIDVNVYCNNPEKLQNSVYNQQIAKYYNMNIDFCNNTVECIDPLLKTGLKMSYDLEKIYYRCKNILEGRPFINNDKVFNNIIMDIVVMEMIPLNEGDKITDRYGGKGVVSKVLADQLMPHYLYNGKWEPVDAQYNSNTVVNRENPGQLLETSATFIAGKIIERIANSPDMTLSAAEEDICTFLGCISRPLAEQYRDTVLGMSFDDRSNFMNSIINDGYIYIVAKPISESMSLDSLRLIYREFPWIELSEMLVPQLDSNNNWRYVKARRRLVTGKKYIYRLKQFAEEKFSAVSLASTNIRSENTKSKMNKMYKTVHAATPVRFGEMELEDLMHMAVEVVIQAIMLLSTSPSARRLHEELLTGNPFDIDIKLDKDSMSRSVEIVNAYLKTAGLRLVFDKIPKKKCNTALRHIVTRVPGAIGLKDVVDKIPGFARNIDFLKEMIAKRREIIGKPMNVAFRVPENIKTQTEADIYIQDKELSEGISAIIELIDDDIKTPEALEKRIEDSAPAPEKLLPIATRWIVERVPNNFAKK